MLLHNEPTKRIRRLKYIRLPHAHGTDRPGCARVASRYPLQRRRRERMDVDDRPALSAENAGSQRSGDPEIRGDFHRIVYAANAEAARAAYATFERTWAKRCAGVVAPAGRRRRASHILQLPQGAVEDVTNDEHD